LDNQVWASIAGFLTSAGGLLFSFFKSRTAGSSFVKGVLKRKPKLLKAVFYPRVAEVGLLLNKLVKKDLLDNKPDELDKLREYLQGALLRLTYK
jgi:hypothetical protein